MTATAEPSAPPLSGPGAIAAFQHDFSHARARARRDWAIGAVLFFVVFFLTAWLGDFFKVAQVTLPGGSRDFRWIIPVGLPKLGDYIENTIPLLRWETRAIT